MTSKTPTFVGSITHQIEFELQQFFSLELRERVAAYLVDGQQVAELRKRLKLPSHNRAELICHQSDDEVELAVFVSDDMLDQLIVMNPLESLHGENIDSFCALVEEISHFHLLIQRAERGLTVSALEMEWQAEIDKFIVCSTLIWKQTGDPHFEPLATLLFDRAKFLSVDERYQIAHKSAAALCHQLIKNSSLKLPPAAQPYWKKMLKYCYHRPMSYKHGQSLDSLLLRVA